ncbi:MAG: hypothetical protein AMXMBFR25_12990 [Lysobacterales bacterium]|nr:hypothetical protein [Xanthomonadales bacterium]
MAGHWRWLWLLGWLLLLARLGFVVGHQPLAGFGNQFDMLRTTACVGLRPEGALDIGQASPVAPEPLYRTDAPIDDNCLPGTEVAIVGLALGVDALADALALGDPQRFPLRLLATLKAALLLLALGLIDWRLRAFPRWRATHVALAAAVCADPFNSLYLAGFYTEFAALLTAWLALAFPLPWLLGARAPSHAGLLVWGLLLAALLLARFQHAFVPFLALLWMAWISWRARWPLSHLLPLLALLLIALATTMHWQRDYAAITDANRWNSFFGAALPAARDPDAFVAALGLPAGCAELAHTTWYLRRGRDARGECAAGMQLARARWLLALARQPDALARWIGRGVDLSGQWRPGYLGELAGTEFGRLPAGALGLGASLADGVAQLPWTGLLFFWSLPLWPLLLRPPGWARLDPGPLAVTHPEPAPDHSAKSVSAAFRRLDPARDWLYPMLALLLALGWAASLVGDGYSELARHLHLAANAALLAALLLPQAAWHAWRAARQERGIAWRTAALVIVAPTLALWWRSQALGYGVLDQPARDGTEAPQALRGWALDPRGIAGIDLVYANGTRVALTTTPAGAELAAIFGAGVGRHALRFEGRAEATAVGYAIEVRPRHGAPTVIDHRFRQQVRRPHVAPLR